MVQGIKMVKVCFLPFIETCRGLEAYFHSFLTSAVDVHDWSASPHDGFELRSSSRFALDRMLAGSHCRSVPYREETNRLSLSGIDLRFAQSIV